MKLGSPFLRFLWGFLEYRPWGFLCEGLEPDLSYPAACLLIGKSFLFTFCIPSLFCIIVAGSCYCGEFLWSSRAYWSVGNAARSEALLFYLYILLWGQTVCTTIPILVIVVCCSDEGWVTSVLSAYTCEARLLERLVKKLNSAMCVQMLSRKDSEALPKFSDWILNSVLTAILLWTESCAIFQVL